MLDTHLQTKHTAPRIKWISRVFLELYSGERNETYAVSLLSAHTHTHTHTRARARTHTHTHARTHVRARAHTRTHARTHACTHARTHARRAHTHTHTHTRAHTHTHTHTHTHNTHTRNVPWVVVLALTSTQGTPRCRTRRWRVPPVVQSAWLALTQLPVAPAQC